MASPQKVVTGTVRLSFPHVFEPHAFEDEEPKYSVMLLIPKSDTATMKKIRAAEQAAQEAGKTSHFGGKIPKNLGSIIKDGDDTADEYPEREGHYYMTVRTKTRPGVVDQNVNPIIDQSQIYSGVYARVSMNAFPYKFGGSMGVSFGLGNLQKVADGEPLGGVTRAEDDFDEIDDGDEDLI